MTTASRRKSGEGAEREMTLKAAAEVTGVPGKLLRRYIRDGRLRPASVDGSKLTVTLAALRDAGLVSSSTLPLARGPEVDAGDREEGEHEPQEAERAEHERADRERADRERAEKERAERDRAERDRAERDRAEKERTDRERAEKERSERERADRERAEKERATAERTERERIERDRAEKARQEQERSERERAERARSDRNAKDRGRGEKDRGGRDQREREARERSDREAREKAEREARESAEREAREKPAVASPRVAAAIEALGSDDEETIVARSQVVTDDDRELADEDDAVEPAETVRLQPDQAAPPVEGRVVSEPPSERSLVVSGGPWVTSAQMNDLLRHIIADREARSSEYLERTEALYREIVESQKTRIGILESEAKSMQAKLEESLRLVPKGENLQALEQTIRDLRIEVDRREAARLDLEHERDRLRDLTDRLRNDLSRAEKRNLEMAEQLRRFRAQGPLDRLLGREPDDR